MGTLANIAPSALPSASTLLANITVLVIFASMVGVGIMRGVKEWREFRKPASTPSANAQIAAATILENVTLSAWTESNKDVVVALGRLCDMLSRHVDETADLRRVVEDVRHDFRVRGTNHANPSGDR